jgi:hypothetical protein
MIGFLSLKCQTVCVKGKTEGKKHPECLIIVKIILTYHEIILKSNNNSRLIQKMILTVTLVFKRHLRVIYEK